MYGSVNEYLDHKMKVAEQLAVNMQLTKPPVHTKGTNNKLLNSKK